jgi:hypothetical protein
MIIKFEHLNEIRRSANKLLKMKYRTYDVQHDKFIREVYCNEHAPKFLTEGKKYRVYAEFETSAMLSGKCLIVFTDSNEFMGFDSEYFLEEFQWDASKKYNL